MFLPSICLILFQKCCLVLSCNTYVHNSDYNFLNQFNQISNCYQSKTVKIIANRPYSNLNNCFRFAMAKRALAFNFKTSASTLSSEFQECQLLDCPETDYSIIANYIPDNKTVSRYYSLFGNFTDLAQSTCIPTIGLFKYHGTASNYTVAKEICAKSGATLAHIVTETRTTLLANALKNWNQKLSGAYVGLESKNSQFFTNIRLNNVQPLECFLYRAWAPNHPKRDNNCVMLSTGKQWKTTDCQFKLPFICEFSESSFKVKNNSTISAEKCTAPPPPPPPPISKSNKVKKS